MERCRERYGDVFTLRIYNESPWVILCGPEHIKQVWSPGSRAPISALIAHA
jgi:hypothetical protein